MQRDKVIQQINIMEIGMKRILDFADQHDGQFTENTCPIAHDHMKLAKILWGIGCLEWKCRFCHIEFAD